MCFLFVWNQPVFSSVAILVVLASEENMVATLCFFLTETRSKHMKD